MTINVHYSISELPQTGYQPRLADDRVGYFLTVLKDFSKKESDDDRFVRYINRWDLREGRSDAPRCRRPRSRSSSGSRRRFRSSIASRSATAFWNGTRRSRRPASTTRSKCASSRTTPTWDPGTSATTRSAGSRPDAGFAMGPSRVNPTTGQILDADIIFDADFLQFWKQEYETFTPASVAAADRRRRSTLQEYRAEMQQMPAYMHESHGAHCTCNMLGGMSRQFAFGAAVMAARKRSDADMEKLIMQGLKEVDDARGRPHARPAAQLQGQHAVLARRHERRREDQARPASAPR